MPNLIFYLNTGAKNNEDKAPIMGKIIHNKKRHYKTIAWIKETDWNPDKKQVRKNHKNAPYNRHKEINSTLNQLQNIMTGFNDYCMINEKVITEADIKKILKGIDPVSNKKSVNRPEIDFIKAFEEWVKYSQNNNEYNTYKVRNTVFNFLNDFQEFAGNNILFDSINMQLFDSLKEYAINEKEYTNNTFAKTIKIIKTFLKWAKSRDYFNGDIPKDFTASERDISPVVLTLEEFTTLFNFDFKTTKHKHVRDIFCFGCVTGLRYSDLNNLRRENIQGDSIVLITKKTKQHLRIPINKYSREIIERYQEQPIFVLPRMSNQKLNDYVEEICREAKLNSPVLIETHKGNKFTQEPKPKHQVVTVHSSRKTFITLSYYLGMSQRVIMEITGIKNDRTLRKYLQVVDDMKKSEMQKAWG